MSRKLGRRAIASAGMVGRAVPRAAALGGIIWVVVLGVSATPAFAMSAATAPCNSSFNPYDYTQAAVRACGLPTFSLSSVTPLADGGSSYHYDIYGSQASVLVPPAGFNPLTATSAQLNEYGFPPRPTDPSALQQWQAEFRNYSGAANPPPFLAGSNITTQTGPVLGSDPITAGTTTSSNWSGYVILGSSGTFTHAETTFVEPDKTYPTVCATHAEVTWAGIGG